MYSLILVHLMKEFGKPVSLLIYILRYNIIVYLFIFFLFLNFRIIAHDVLLQVGVNPMPSSFLTNFIKSHKDLTNLKITERKAPIGKWGSKLGEVVTK